MTSFNFENLDVYQKAVNFTKEIYRVTRTFPKEELFGLTSQLRRASLSVSTNIAEGSNRSYKHFSAFLDIARGSVLECIPLLRIAVEEKYITDELFDILYSYCEALSKMISALKRSLTTNSERRTTN